LREFELLKLKPKENEIRQKERGEQGERQKGGDQKSV